MPEGKVQGPASYFPSIEKTYGKPIAHWLELLGAMKGKTHMEMVAALKGEQLRVLRQTEFSRISPHNPSLSLSYA